MNMTTICASVDGETLRITKRPPVASGGVQQCRVQFTFSDDWTGLTKAAIFADGNKKHFYQVLIGTDNCAAVPWEVLLEKGAFWLGAEGVSGSVKFTSELIRYPILEGAREGGATKPPTPGIYDEILDKIDVLREDMDDVENDVTDLQGDITDLQGNVTDLQGDVTRLQSDVGSMGSSLRTLDGRVSAAESDIDGMQDQIGQMSEKLDSLPESTGGGVDSIERFASFNSVYNILISDHETINVDSTALIYDGHDYHTFQHDFALPLTAGPDIEPYITEDKKHFALRLTGSAGSGGFSANLAERVDSLSDSMDTLSNTADALSGKVDSLESANHTLSAAVETLEAAGADGVPDYFRAHLEEKEAAIRQAITDAGRNRSAFLFVTDLHWDTNRGHSPALIRHILDHTPLRTVFCGGDILPESGHVELDEAMAMGQDWQNAFRPLRNDCLCMPGDSDFNRGDSMYPTDHELSDNQLFGWLQADMDGRGITAGPDLSFCFDHSMEKTRYLVLDSHRTVVSEDSLTFMADKLKSLPEDWHCIVLTHMYQYLSKNGDTSSAIDFFQTGKPIGSMIQGYHNRQMGGITNGIGNVLYDFTESVGTVSAVIAGHLHFDCTTRTPDGVPVIQPDCDGIDTLSEAGAAAGTVNEQAITAVIVDYDQNKISCLRIGRGDDFTVTITQ